ncbi:MAG: peptidyl-prolyl cis-trans isomerase, partial [Pirellulaceae bacterium]
LSDTWQQRWNRSPTEQELDGLIKQYLRETVLYREAVSMGLDKDDTIIRRRMAQKLEFLANDLIQPETPSDEDLTKYFEENIDQYQAPELVTFTHVFLDPDKRENATLDDAEQLKSQLIAEGRDPADISGVGDPFMLQRYYPERPESEVAKLFGREFAANVLGLETRQWHGPVLSGYGVHLVYVHGRREFPVPDFDMVADQVREDWMNAKRAEMNDEYIDSLLARYTVVIEGQGDDQFGLAGDDE